MRSLRALLAAAGLFAACSNADAFIPSREVGKVSAVANLTTSGAIGAAALATDTRVITMAQTTSGLTFTLPNPGDTSAIVALDVINTGSASFTMYGVTLAPSTLLHLAWSGSAWTPDGATSTSKTIQAGNSAATSGTTATFTFTFATAFSAAPAVSLGVFSGGATAPQVTTCQADSVSTTQVAGHCSSTQNTTVGALGSVVAPVAAATGVVVSVLAIGRTQ